MQGELGQSESDDIFVSGVHVKANELMITKKLSVSMGKIEIMTSLVI